jgi:hypothetical protein
MLITFLDIDEFIVRTWIVLTLIDSNNPSPYFRREQVAIDDSWILRLHVVQTIKLLEQIRIVLHFWQRLTYFRFWAYCRASVNRGVSVHTFAIIVATSGVFSGEKIALVPSLILRHHGSWKADEHDTHSGNGHEVENTHIPSFS